MWRAWVKVAVVAGAAACTSSRGYPESVTVNAFAGPRSPDGDYVVFFQPWEDEQARVVPRGTVELLRPLDHATVTCANVTCESRPESGAVVLGKPEAGVDHVDIVIQKDGFEPLTLSVPFRGSAPFVRMLVLLRPKEAR